MEFKVNLSKKFSQLKLFISLFGWTFRTFFQLYPTPQTWTVGQSSRCADGSHVLFFDYDNLDLNEIVPEIKYLQKKEPLIGAYFFKLDRDKSFHVIIPQKMFLNQCFEIIEKTSSDYSFKIAGIRKGLTKEWILRAFEKGKRGKPKFIGYLPSNFECDVNKISFEHIHFMEEHYEATKAKLLEYEENEGIGLVRYNTSNRIK